MPVYQTTFEINAPASWVWQVLTGLERYAGWNPQIPTASGRLEVGGRIRLRLALPERPTLDLSATIEEVLPERLLTWRGHVVRRVLRGLPQVRDPAHRRWSHLGHACRGHSWVARAIVLSPDGSCGREELADTECSLACSRREYAIGGRVLPRLRCGLPPNNMRMQPTGRSGARLLARGTLRWRHCGSVNLCGRGHDPGLPTTWTRVLESERGRHEPGAAPRLRVARHAGEAAARRHAPPGVHG